MREKSKVLISSRRSVLGMVRAKKSCCRRNLRVFPFLAFSAVINFSAKCKLVPLNNNHFQSSPST